MIVKVNATVRPANYKGRFIIKLLEVDMFKDDVLAQKVAHLEGEAMGYLRDRDVPEALNFEFFISALSLGEVVAELKAEVLTPSGKPLGESNGVPFSLLKDFDPNGAMTIDLQEIVI